MHFHQKKGLAKRIALRSVVNISLLTCMVSALQNPYPDLLADGNTAVRYFGSVTAEVFLASTVSEYNYNGSIECPRQWDLGTLSGAYMDLYPGVIDSYNDAPYPGMEEGGGLAMRTELFAGHRGAALTYNIDGLNFMNVLISNGSTPGPFLNDGTPAVLAPDPVQLAIGPWALIPAWTINGTQDAFAVDSTAYGSVLQCDNSRNRGYCGYAQDENQHGCWTRQFFAFNMDTTSNFSIRFSDNDATVDIWVESEFNSTGANSLAHLVFTGDRHLPSVTNYEYWTHSPLDYELAQQYINDIKLEADDNNMPVFRNNTATQDWWATANGTFHFASGAFKNAAVLPLVWLLVLGFFMATLL